MKNLRETWKTHLKRKFFEAMTEKVVSVSSETPITNAAEIMVKNKIKRLPVVEGEKLAGIVTRGDLIEAMI